MRYDVFMNRLSLKRIYTYTSQLPWNEPMETLQNYLSERAKVIQYAAPSLQTSEGGERTLCIRPQNKLSLYHNSFRPDMEFSVEKDTLLIRCSLTKVIRCFICVLSCMFLLFQIAFLFLADPAKPIPTLLPSLMLVFANLLTIVGLRLNSRRLLNILFPGAFEKQS